MRFCSIVLAAGAGSRFGGDKLLAQFRGEHLVVHALRAALRAPVDRVILVCQPDFDFDADPVEFVHIRSADLSTSLKAGIDAARGFDGAFIFLGDMPLIPLSVTEQLAARLNKNFAAVPRHKGRNGHPVLLSARAFAEIANLRGDEGAGRLLKARKDVAFVDCADEGVLLDIDRAEDIARLENRGGA